MTSNPVADQLAKVFAAFDAQDVSTLATFITDDVQLNRSLTQPTTIDINNIDSTKLPYLLGKGAIAPIPVAKYKLWSETVPLFTKGSYPNGKMATTQGLAPIEAMLSFSLGDL